MEAKQQREEQYQKEIEELLVKDAEEYNKLKIKLETDIQTLEQQLEEMRATYQLNTEKLEYNYRVLTERDNENSNTLAQLKRKQNKLKDMLSALVQKYQETDTRDRKKNDELTEEYRRITKQYKDLQAKFRHFEISDKKRFEQVWSMHEEEVGDLVAKVLRADEIIARQQLGWSWRAPNMDALRDPTLIATSAAPGAATAPAAALLDAAAAAVEADGADGDGSRAVSGELIKAMLELLASEAGFLLDPKVKEALDALPPDEAELAQAESMLRALGVRDEADVAALTRFFFPPGGSGGAADAGADGADAPADAPAAAPGEGDAGEDAPAAAPDALSQIKEMIAPNDVIRAVHAFVNERNAALAGAGGRKSAAAAAAAAAAGDASALVAQQEAEEKEYWARMSGVISEPTYLVWKQLEKQLISYNEVLQTRSNCIGEVTSLREQNMQLKGLLNQYLNARVNDELIVPPTDTIHLAMV